MTSQREAFEKWWDSDTFADSSYAPLSREYLIEECSPLYWAHQGWQAAQADQAEYIAMRELNNKFKDEALKMAIGAMTYHIEQTRPIEDTNKAIQACKEALAQPESQPESVQKPLSEEEIGNMAVNSYTYYDLARAIEKHHGIGE